MRHEKSAESAPRHSLAVRARDPCACERSRSVKLQKQVEYTGFSDVPGSAWYADSVKTVCEYGLMNGKADAKFSPSGNMTIAEAVAIGCRLHDIYVGGSGKFEPSSPWYKAYVDYWLAFAEFPYYFRGKDASFWSSEITREIFAFVMDEALPEEAYKTLTILLPEYFLTLTYVLTIGVLFTLYITLES